MLADQQVRGGAWLELREGTQIGYRIERNGTSGFAEFQVFGAVGLELSMSSETVRLRRDLFDQALAEIGNNPLELSEE